jgi:hypothetical protein
VSVTASSDLANVETLESILDNLQAGYLEVCEYGGREFYSDPLFVGSYDLYEDCGGVGTTVVALAAEPEDPSYYVVVQFQAVADRDFEALDAILNTFNVIGDV